METEQATPSLIARGGGAGGGTGGGLGGDSAPHCVLLARHDPGNLSGRTGLGNAQLQKQNSWVLLHID